jgi:hypothetical protein
VRRPDRSVLDVGDPDRGEALPSADGEQLWRVFVILRDRPGVHERSIRASGPLEAEHAVAVADRDVLETLGSQFLGRCIVSLGGKAEYRALEAVSRRFLRVRQWGRPGSAVSTRMPIVEIVTPKQVREGAARRAGTERKATALAR